MADLAYLIRHGQSTFNEHFEATDIDPMHIDARLTKKGRAQVMAAGPAARRLQPDIVVASPPTNFAIERTRATQ